MSDRGGLRPAAASSSSIGSIDDLPVFASTSFSEPAVMMPPMGGGRSNNDNRLIYGLIAGVGVLALVMIVLVVKVLGKNDAPAVAVVTQPAAGGGTPSKPAPGPAPTIPATPTDGVKPGTDVAAGSGTPTTPTTVASNDVPPPPDQKPDPVVAAKPDPKRPDPSAKKPDPKKPDSLATKPPVVKPEPTPGPPKPEAGRACDEVSCVLNNYEGSCCAKYKKGGKPTAAPSGDLPASLDRTMVSDGVGKVKGKVMSCGDRSSAKGTVKVSVKVGSDGRVVSASVKESPDPALGNCVASAMQKATFARTQTGGSFAYPFSF